jgi:hypothetical protein
VWKNGDNYWGKLRSFVDKVKSDDFTKIRLEYMHDINDSKDVSGEWSSRYKISTIIVGDNSVGKILRIIFDSSNMDMKVNVWDVNSEHFVEGEGEKYF